MVDIMMPQLGETVTEGTVTRWSKAVGEAVAEDEVLFEVSTDKVDSEVRSPATGYLSEILVPEGDTVDVGVKLAVIAPEPPGTAPAATPPPAAAQSDALRRPTDPWAASEGVAAGYDGAGGSSGKGDGTGLVLSPVVRRLLAEHGLDPVSVAGT
ncbi:MAG: biotin/lipoyl-containing protein, partial [Acidimicrobiales bacterium]